MVTVEVAMGNVWNRAQIFKELDRLPIGFGGRDEEVRRLVESEKLFGRGVGYVDAHLLVAVRLTPEAVLWTRDKRLQEVALELGVGFEEARPNQTGTQLERCAAGDD